MKSLKKLIESKKFDWVNSNITEDLFPLVKRKHKGYKLFHFDRYISSEAVIREMEKEGYMPANTLELLEWKDWNDKDWVVALGSVGGVYGSRFVPGLDGGDSLRGLRLDHWGGGWLSRCRFLGVRNCTSALEPKPLEKPFDPLIFGHLETIERSIKEIRNLIK
jgi:hypothetical protein